MNASILSSSNPQCTAPAQSHAKRSAVYPALFAFFPIPFNFRLHHNPFIIFFSHSQKKKKKFFLFQFLFLQRELMHVSKTRILILFDANSLRRERKGKKKKNHISISEGVCLENGVIKQTMDAPSRDLSATQIHFSLNCRCFVYFSYSF